MTDDRHPWTYRRVIPVAPFATHDAAVIDSATSNADQRPGPDPDNSPYRGIDTQAAPNGGGFYIDLQRYSNLADFRPKPIFVLSELAFTL